MGYGPAWIGHYFVEGNRPTTFEHPVWSLRADLKMLRLIASDQIDEEILRLIADGQIPPNMLEDLAAAK